MPNNTYTKQTLTIEEEYPTFLREEHLSSLEEIEQITVEIAELYQKHLEWGYHYAQQSLTTVSGALVLCCLFKGLTIQHLSLPLAFVLFSAIIFIY